MKRLIYYALLCFLLVCCIHPLHAEDPTNPSKQKDTIKQLEAQLEAIRTQLRKTEARLQQARQQKAKPNSPSLLDRFSPSRMLLSMMPALKLEWDHEGEAQFGLEQFDIKMQFHHKGWLRISLDK